MDRKECLDAAKQCVCSDRDQQYGSPDVNMKKIAEFWTTYKGVEFSPKDVGVMMALLNIARISSGQSKDDNYIDASGFLSLSCELVTEDSTGTTSTINI